MKKNQRRRKLRTHKLLTLLVLYMAVFNLNTSDSMAQQAQIDVLSPFNQQTVKPAVPAVKPPNTAVKSNVPQTTAVKPAQPTVENKDIKEAKIKKDDINPLLNPSNTMGLIAAENNINKAFTLIQQNKFSEAKLIMEPATEWLANATEYHTNLYKALKDIDTAKTQADLEKELALKFAIYRDQAMYQLALLYIEDKKHQKAVEKLVNVVRSQPKTQLGFSAYQVLQQIGFTYKVQLPASTESENTETKNEKTD